MTAENITDAQRQLSAVMLQVQQDIMAYGKVQTQTAETLRDAQMKAKYGVENFTKASSTAGQALGALAGAGIASTQAMYQGKKGMSAFNSSLDEVAKAAALAGTALTLLVPGGFIIKGIIAGVTMVATAAIAMTKAANEMSDKLYKGYSSLQKSGAAASDGMTGVFRDAKKLGLSMDELDSMVSLVAENSQDLALFAGTVYDGRKKLADMGQALEGSRAEFFKLGLTQTEVNEGMANSVKILTRTGRAQTMTTDQLAASARNYIYEQDALAKITGLSTKKQQEVLEKALQNEQFQSKIRQLEADGNFKQADELKKLNAYYAAMGDESAEGFQATVNGNLMNKAAQKLNFASQGEALRSTQEVADGTKSASQAFDAVASRVSETEKTIGRTQAAFGTTANNSIKYGEQVNFGIAATGEKREELEKKVNAEIEKQKKGADKITGNQGDMIKTQQEINKKLEEDILATIPQAQANMARLAGVTNKLADGFSLLTKGINKLLNLLGLGEKEAPVAKQTTSGERAAMAATQGARDTAKPLQDRVDQLNKEITQDEKKLKDAKRAGKYGEEEKRLEEKILANKKEYEEESNKLVEAEKKISQLGKEEHHLRVKQQADRQTLHKLENQNLKDTEEIKVQNEKKINAQKAGDTKGVASAEAEIKNRQSSIQGRSAQVTQLQTDLKTSGGAKPEDVLEFSGASGGRENFDGLNENMKTKLLAAGQQYFEQTGQKLKMNSGARDPEDQKRLYEETVSAGRPGIGPTGMPVAPPGKSSHETGGAVDIQNYSDPKALAALGREGLRQTVPKDPVHFQLQAADGGVFSGPDEGYPAALHGEEAVIPLNNGGGNFVKIFEDMAMMMGKQVGAIDELIRVAKNGNDIQTKILRQQA